MAQRKVEAVVKGAWLTETKNKNPQVEIEFVLENGNIITRYGSLNGGALIYTVKDLRTCGWEGDNIEDLSSVGGGLAVQLVIEDEEYPEGSGKIRDRIVFINSKRQRVAPPPGVGERLRAAIASLPREKSHDFGGADDFKT